MLDWHSADRTHRADLRRFRCTDPATTTFDDERGFVCHDAPWEFEVQQYINELIPPAFVPEFLLVGYDEVGLAAVIEMRVFEFDRYCFISAVAVAHRVSGSGLAGTAIDLVHNVLSKYGLDADYFVEARIDPENDAAKRVFARRGYSCIDHYGMYEVWARKC